MPILECARVNSMCVQCALNRGATSLTSDDCEFRTNFVVRKANSATRTFDICPGRSNREGGRNAHRCTRRFGHVLQARAATVHGRRLLRADRSAEETRKESVRRSEV